jgi:hypothetical protein
MTDLYHEQLREKLRSREVLMIASSTEPEDVRDWNHHIMRELGR